MNMYSDIIGALGEEWTVAYSFRRRHRPQIAVDETDV